MSWEKQHILYTPHASNARTLLQINKKIHFGGIWFKAFFFQV